MDNTTTPPREPEGDTRTDGTPKVLSREEIDALTTSTSPYRLRYKIVGSAPGEDGATLNWIYKSVEDEDTADLVVQNLTSSTCVPSLETTLQHQAKRIDSLRAQLRGVNRKLRESNVGMARMARNHAQLVGLYMRDADELRMTVKELDTKYWALKALYDAEIENRTAPPPTTPESKP